LYSSIKIKVIFIKCYKIVITVYFSKQCLPGLHWSGKLHVHILTILLKLIISIYFK